MNAKIKKTMMDIKSIKIQGATNIAKASVGALSDLSKKLKNQKINLFLSEIEKSARELSLARPNEPLNQNIMNFLVSQLEKDKNCQVKILAGNFQNRCKEILRLISRNEKLIAENGAELLKQAYRNKKKPLNVFTHCNSSAVSNMLLKAREEEIPLKVYNSETRPKFQGKILAECLGKKGIKVTMTVDSAAPFLISRIDPDNIDADLVVIGCDEIASDGSVLNKIGSYSLSLSAKNAEIPLYVTGTLLKLGKNISSYKEFKIEKRSAFEIWRKRTRNLKILNYAFDIVPSEYIAGFITEFGILKPKDVRKIALKNYGGIFES